MTAPTDSEWSKGIRAYIEAGILRVGSPFEDHIAPLIERVRAAERARTAEDIAAGIEDLRDWAFEYVTGHAHPCRGHYDAAAAVARSHTKEPE